MMNFSAHFKIVALQIHRSEYCSYNESVKVTQPRFSHTEGSVFVLFCFFYCSNHVLIPLNQQIFKVPARFWSAYSKTGLTQSNRDEPGPPFP